MRNHTLQIIKGDITKIKADAIVNAANNSLMGGGGVDGAIHRAGGPEILEDCKKIVAHRGECRTGEAVVTTAGNLPAKYVIHTVGPVWNGGEKGEPELLYNCYRNSLMLANGHQCKTIAFPNISTGVYRFPKPLAAEIAQRSVRDFLENSEHQISEVIIVCFDDENYKINREMV
ncbi:O-acetyl-ADP-ribose deacetylase [Sinomicrobium kalidii]|uniref:O-acetyl-ADP-ribose deacetylase n=1 Tax=Sinomicrobium kalidii TaxID=2900738 RepID=UPI001E2A4ED7|nr:O-acetyl-ADP-ribose deacetylase [Sinomicrobium kalidii]UGU16768.1 O-acetyl-ADP-ribose deacetylase [Sinomicrobium kalidii]